MYAHLQMPHVPLLGQQNYMPESLGQWYYRTHGDGRFVQYGLEPARFLKDNRHLPYDSIPRRPDPPQYDSRCYADEPPPKHEWWFDSSRLSLHSYQEPLIVSPPKSLCLDPPTVEHPWHKKLEPEEDWFLNQDR